MADDDLQRQIDTTAAEAKRLGRRLEDALAELDRLREQERVAGMTAEERRKLWRVVHCEDAFVAALLGITAAVITTSGGSTHPQ